MLDAVRIVPSALWKHLGSQFGEQAPDLTIPRFLDLGCSRRMNKSHEVQTLQDTACQDAIADAA